MSPSSVPNFSPIRVRIRVLWQILRSVRNEDEEEEEKNEEIKTKFCSLVSRKCLDRFLQIWYVDSHYWPAHVCSKFGSNRIRDHRAT